MNFILKRIGLIAFGIASLLESVLNILLYVTFLDIPMGKVFDFSLPFFFWYSDRVLKAGFLRDFKNKEGRLDG